MSSNKKLTSHFSALSLKAPWNCVAIRLQKPRRQPLSASATGKAVSVASAMSCSAMFHLLSVHCVIANRLARNDMREINYSWVLLVPGLVSVECFALGCSPALRRSGRAELGKILLAKFRFASLTSGGTFRFRSPQFHPANLPGDRLWQLCKFQPAHALVGRQHLAAVPENRERHLRGRLGSGAQSHKSLHHRVARGIRRRYHRALHHVGMFDQRALQLEGAD